MNVSETTTLSCLVFRDLRPVCAVVESCVLRVLSEGEWGAGEGGEAERPLPFEVLGVEGPRAAPQDSAPRSGAARVLVLGTDRGTLPLLIPGALTFEHFDVERFAPLSGRAFDASVFSGVITRDESIDVFLLDPNRLIESLEPCPSLA